MQSGLDIFVRLKNDESNSTRLSERLVLVRPLAVHQAQVTIENDDSVGDY